MIDGIAVAFVHSPHGEGLAQWYSETLGLPVMASFPNWKEFKMADGSRFAVDVTTFPRSVVEKQAIMLAFSVKDIDAAVRDLTARGVRFYVGKDGNTVFDVGPARVATFMDPDGNWMQLSQRKAG
jgi:catechol 2,3-dioxygenase-like lactoylglutathione lyase family enzyme